MGSLVRQENWRSLAACRSADPDLFFPVSSSGASLAQVAEAKAICARCQVRRDCLAFALRTHQVHGVWGGLSEQERYALWSATLAGSSAAGPPRSTQFTPRLLEVMRINEPPPHAR
jgi:WhiB family transcriptional regulator, redox-sensing transcriptional regulator